MDPVLSIDPCGLERQETVSTVIPIKRPDEDNHPLKKKKKRHGYLLDRWQDT